MIQPLTDKDRCWVFYKKHSVLTKYEFVIDEESSIQDVILQAVAKIQKGSDLG